MEIDIRQGYQVECINCGRCLDACRKVMTGRKEPGLIRYSFGVDGNGVRALFNPRTLLLSAALLALLTILTTAIIFKPQASLKVAISHTAGSRVLADASLATFFTAWVSNRSNQPGIYHLEAYRSDNRQPLTLRGQTSGIKLAPGDNREIQFAVTTAVPDLATAISFTLYDDHQEELARAGATITAP